MVMNNLNEEEKNVFCAVKNAYTQIRLKEKEKLRLFLKENGFEVRQKNAGHGRSDYGRTHLEKLYDNTNWMWIEACRDNALYIISFQAFDQDPGSKNRHALMDRIGVYKYECDSFEAEKKKKTSKYNADDAFERMQTSAYDLPLSAEDMRGLVDWMGELPCVEPKP